MFKRLIENKVIDALTSSKVVLLTGPRQTGKTTLAEKIGRGQMSFLNLDNPTLLAAAKLDPIGFLEGKDRVVIDEIQRAPALIETIKSIVDSDSRCGRFLLTGSTNLTTKPIVTDILADRLEAIQMFPLSQSEIHSGQGNFLDYAFGLEIFSMGKLLTSRDLVDLVVAGGYPEALDRKSQSRRNKWYLNYVDYIVHHDIPEFANTVYTSEIPKLLGLIAEFSGNLMNYSKIGSELVMSRGSIQKYIEILESMFLVSSLQPWTSNMLNRLLKSPKQHLLDTGLLTSVRNISADEIQSNRNLFGPILETFVVSELRKIATWSTQKYIFSHFRDRDGKEIDLIIENMQHQIVGIEVKSSTTVNVNDFNQLRRLAKFCGKKFLRGIVLYDGNHVASFGDKMVAVPLSCLWR